MSTVYVLSDPHFGHKNQIRWRSGFLTHEHVADLIIRNYVSKVRKRDLVWFLGDVIIHEKDRWLAELKKLPGEKRLILGNHDSDSSSRPSLAELSEVFTQIHGMYKCKDAWLSHAPIHPDELRGRYCIHGHTHFHCVSDTRYYNACLEVNNYEPVSYQEIIGKLKERNESYTYCST